ncbi:hypothetical protein HK405_006377, partial [Cladochytrium tenue]
MPSAGGLDLSLATGKTAAFANAWSAARSNSPARKRYRLADLPVGIAPPDRPSSPLSFEGRSAATAATPLVFDADAEDALGCVDADPTAYPPLPAAPSTPITLFAQPAIASTSACLVRLPAPTLRTHCLPLPLSHRLLTWSGPAPSPRQDLAPYWLDPSAPPAWHPPQPSPLSEMVPAVLASDAADLTVCPTRNRLTLPAPTSPTPSDLPVTDATASGPRIVEILDDSVDSDTAFSLASLAAPLTAAPLALAAASPSPSPPPSSGSSWSSSLFDGASPPPVSRIPASAVFSATAWWGASANSRDLDCMD